MISAEWVSVGFGLLAVLMTVVGLQLNAAISGLDKRQTEARATEREELRRWINGSFMRSSETQSRLEGMAEGISKLEQRLASVEHICWGCRRGQQESD